MFIDDIKLFTANERELHPALKEVKLCLEDVNMSLGNDKCQAVMTVKRGEMRHNQALQPYKFLGTKEPALQDSRLMREETAKEFLQRAWLFWSSPLSEKHKVQTTTTFAPPALTYHMPIIHWPVNDLKELDRILKKFSTIHKQSTQRPRMSCCTSLEQKEDVALSQWNRCKKETKIKTALHMHRSTDPAVKAAAKADLIRMQKGRRSITRDANTFAYEINMEISTNQDEEWEIKFESQNKSTHLARGQTVKNVLTRARTEAAEHSIENQKWQGKLINNRLNDENIGLHCFDWLTNWEDCPSKTIRDVEEIYQRLVPTKVYYRDKLRY